MGWKLGVIAALIVGMAPVAAASGSPGATPPQRPAFRFASDTMISRRRGGPLTPTWFERPSTQEARRLSRERVRGPTYVNVICRSYKDRHLGGCLVDQADPDTPAVRSLGLKLARRYGGLEREVDWNNVSHVLLSLFVDDGTPAEGHTPCLPILCQPGSVPAPPPPPR